MAISRKLMQRGVERNVIKDALDQFDHDYQQDHEHDAELESALIYARKRRLGPYAKLPMGKTTMKDGWQHRHYASFARAGFTSRTISTVMALNTPDDAEKLLADGVGLK